MTERIYCSVCYHNRVRFVGDVCRDCQNPPKPSDEDQRIRAELEQQEKKPRTVSDVWFGRRK